MILIISCKETVKWELPKIECISDSMTIYCSPNENVIGGQNSWVTFVIPYYSYFLSANGCNLFNDTVIVQQAKIDTMYVKDIVVKNWGDSTVLELLHSINDDTLKCFQVIAKPSDSLIQIFTFDAKK